MKASEIFALLVFVGLLNIVQVKGDIGSLNDIWHNISTDDSADIEMYLSLAKTREDEQNTIAELQATVRQHLRTTNLANALSINEYSKSSTKLKAISKNMIENYNTQLIEDILYDAINDIYSSQSHLLLIDSLHQIYTAGDLASLELMLRAQLKLMRLYDEKSNYKDKELLRKYAYMLHKIRQDNLYGSVNVFLKSALDVLITKLPNNLQYLLFNPYFCLINAKYSGYIFTHIEGKIDEVSRYIWVWLEDMKNYYASHIKADIYASSDGNNTNFKVSLKGTFDQLYYYKMPSTNRIAGWESTDEPLYNIWDIEFLDNDRVSFTQNDYIMCSIQDKYGEKYNVTALEVTGYKLVQYSQLNEECQWYLGQCDRTKVN